MLTDTDRLTYKIEAGNVYKDFYKDKELFDISNCSKDSNYYNNANNVVKGKMNNEICGVSNKSFVGLKSEMYNFIKEENYESKEAKCVNKNVLFKRSYMTHEMNKVQGKDHEIRLHRITKL